MIKKPCVETDALTVHPALKEFFGYCLVKAALKLRGMMDDGLSKYGLIAPMLGILRILRHGGAISQVELGRATGIDKASMVKVIDQLEELGMVIRTEGAPDRRIKLISLTKSGARRLDQAARVREKVEEDFLAPLSAEEKRILRAALPKLIG